MLPKFTSKFFNFFLYVILIKLIQIICSYIKIKKKCLYSIKFINSKQIWNTNLRLNTLKDILNGYIKKYSMSYVL